MKKIIYRLLFTSFVLIAILTGCNDNFLEITPTDRISEASLIADSSLYEDFVINRYMGVILQQKEGEGTPPGFGRGFEYALWSTITDESMYTSDDNSWLIQKGQLSPENEGIAVSFWGRSYRGIRECNFALSIIDKVQISGSAKKRLIAELKFIRAYRYFDLVHNYGKVVLLGDKVYELGDDFSQEEIYMRSDLSTCTAYVADQLGEAAVDLPIAYSSNWVKGRATKGAALALKARMLLYDASPLYNNGTINESKMQVAADAAKAVMDLKVYSLHSDYNGLFLATDSKESIFSRYYVTGQRHVCLEIAYGPNGYGGWGGSTPFQNLVDAYEMNNGLPIDDPASGFNNQNPYINRDSRFYATILYNGADYRGRQVETFIPKGKDSKEGSSNWNTSQTGYYLRKWMDDKNPIDNPWNVAGLQPWPYIRYAEVLLNYAEAQNEAAGPDQSVYNAINTIRVRAKMPTLPSGLSKEEMRERIRNERQVELAFEEHRYYDVRRWMIADKVENIPGYGIKITKSGNNLSYEKFEALSGRKFETKHYWLPIPRAEIQASNDKLEQNPGY